MCEDARVLHSGIWKLGGKDAMGDPAAEGLIYERLAEHVFGVIDAYPVVAVVYEQPTMARGFQLCKMMGYRAIIVMESYALGLAAHPVHCASVKLHATGNGHAKKKMMMNAAAEQWPEIDLIDDNHADALWVGKYAIDHEIVQITALDERFCGSIRE